MPEVNMAFTLLKSDMKTGNDFPHRGRGVPDILKLHKTAARQLLRQKIECADFRRILPSVVRGHDFSDRDLHPAQYFHNFQIPLQYVRVLIDLQHTIPAHLPNSAAYLPYVRIL